MGIIWVSGDIIISIPLQSYILSWAYNGEDKHSWEANILPRRKARPGKNQWDKIQSHNFRYIIWKIPGQQNYNGLLRKYKREGTMKTKQSWSTEERTVRCWGLVCEAAVYRNSSRPLNGPCPQPWNMNTNTMRFKYSFQTTIKPLGVPFLCSSRHEYMLKFPSFLLSFPPSSFHSINTDLRLQWQRSTALGARNAAVDTSDEHPGPGTHSRVLSGNGPAVTLWVTGGCCILICCLLLSFPRLFAHKSPCLAQGFSVI